MIERARDVAQR